MITVPLDPRAWLRDQVSREDCRRALAVALRQAQDACDDGAVGIARDRWTRQDNSRLVADLRTLAAALDWFARHNIAEVIDAPTGDAPE